MFLDLHRHLEGSHSAHALLEVARTFDIRKPPFYDAATGEFLPAERLTAALTMTAPSDDAMIFYRCIQQARVAYVHEAAVRELARRAFVEAADDSDGFEMRLSLFSMARTVIENQQGKIDWQTFDTGTFAETARGLLLAVIAARDEAMAATKKPMTLRLGLSRTFESEPHYRALASMVIEHARALVGLDVLGIVPTGDKEPMPAPLVKIIDQLRPHLTDLTIHAGEFSGHESVDRTLALGPRGIGHGVHAVQSDATLERLAKDGVTLEVCPTSNHLLIPTALAALRRQRSAEPLVALQRAHVHCVLGSDDPTPMGTSFQKELDVARRIGVDMTRLQADIARRWQQITGYSCGVISSA